MSAQVFEARWSRIQRSREQGYEELSDFLGRHASLGPLVRCGLVRKREEWSEFQRYYGYVPTEKGESYLLYIPDKELVLVRPGKSAPLFLELKNDPAPQAPFKETYAEPTQAQFMAVEEMRMNAGRDGWRVKRADVLRQYLMQGFMDIRSFTKRTGVGEGGLLREGLIKPRPERINDQHLNYEITKEGAAYLTPVDAFDLLLIAPGMELPLLCRLDEEKASYWCGLP
ncbi:MAG TPA: hypothetical protein PKN30_01660 [Flavobacteriales bacterium]|nr:hypothetical protein [Flavobacteriales bacterium]